MPVYNKIIKIQKLDINTEEWTDYYISEKAEKDKNPYIHANINKSSGKEYFNARTEISGSTFNFKVRYCEALRNLMFNTEIYRIVYDSKIFNITNVDDYQLNHNELTIVGDSCVKNIN